jgi:aspartate/methionine/tyrosine aminotransferase
VTRFPTYAAEEALRARASEPVPLYGTPAPALPEHVVDAVARVLSEPMRTPPARGLEELREALARELLRSTGRAVDPATELVVTNGAMQALGVVFRTVLEPGDEVVVPAPCFFFETAIRRGGGAPVYVSSSPDRSWAWDLDALAEAAARSRARVLLLCNPENPTGHVPSRDEVSAAVALAERHGLLVVTDEAYERSLWDGAELASAFGAYERTLVIRSLGKSLSLPQLRLGCIAGPAELVSSCAVTLEWDCLRVGIASQTAADAALTGPQEWLDAVHEELGRSREVALRAVSDVEAITLVAPRAGPFLFLGATDGRTTLADELVAVGLPVVDGQHFQAPGWARLPFGGAERCRDALEAALGDWAERHA